MNQPDCAREQELVEAMTTRGWLQVGASDLRRHVAECRSCREIMVLAEALRSDRDAACSDARLPSASHVWWRAQVRARLEAVEEAERPITAAQVLGAVALAALATSAGGLGWLMARSGRVWEQLIRLDTNDASEVVTMVSNTSALTLALAIVCACVFVLTPIVFLVALSEE
jgi:hypothetical protein